MQSGQPAPPNGVSATPPPPQYTNSGGSYGAPPPGAYYDQYGQPYPVAAAAPPVPGATAGAYGPPTGAPQYAPSPVAYNQSPYYAPPYAQYAPAPPPPQQPYYYQPAPPPSAAAAPPVQGGYYGSATSATSQNHSGEYGTPYVYAPQTAAGTAAAAAPPTPQHMHHMQAAQQGYMQPGQGYAPYGGQPQTQQMYAPQVYQTQPPQQQLHSAGMPYGMYAVQGSMGQGPAAAASQAFARADEGNKGQLDVKGFKMALESLGINITYDQLLKYFAMADRDRDGNIAEPEFISLYQNEIYRV